MPVSPTNALDIQQTAYFPTLQISDDEDDTHPNIDTPSLFRWRHQARVERMSEHEISKQKFDNERLTNKKELTEIQEKLKSTGDDSAKLNQLQTKMKHLELKKQELDKQEEELRLKEKKTPWNIDTISKPAFSKTIINTKSDKESDANLTEEQKEEKMRNFVKDNEKVVKQFGMLRRYEDSKKFLLDHAHLACESTANYLVIWCINLQMEEKTELMTHVAHQCICMQVRISL